MKPLRRRLPRARSSATAVALALAAVALGASPASAAPVLASATVTAPATATVGDVVDVSVVLTGTADVYAYDLEVGFDDVALDYVADSATSPSGGFDDVQVADGSLSILHTRLGSSPALTGDLTVDLQFTAVAAGSAAVSIDSVELIGADGSSLVVTPTASAVVAVAAAPVAPQPSASPTAGAPAPSASPTATAPVTGAAAGRPTATGSRDDLAFTGSDSWPLVAGSAGLLVLGLLVVAAVALRRRAAATR